ncbi:hypothetical protein GOEFS_028_00170 [Gordonia effusa NBRC 100432]|uniref:Lipase n=1 Tax=Gordonia effusa NBRC 100432 TaxID=1077974 RepID=H0QX02_9ACTN|nr:lipase family protein [Gordonia effusa]GAB17353.1 hypothetical protein GOEFS_028_00170 [Gordonia effusa NBRC 100432]
MKGEKTIRSRIAIALAAAVPLVGLAIATPASALAAPQQAGTVLSSKDITGNVDAKIAGAQTVISMTYLSPGSDGKLVPVRGTVMIPKQSTRPNGLRYVGYAHGTAGLGDGCTVTDRMGHGGRYDDWLGPWLKDGYVITATEYAGIGGPGQHAYLDGPTAGKNVLDSVRAARTIVAQRNLKSSNGFIASGGSQGGHASLWASNEAQAYAPEIQNVGAAVSSPPVDIADYFKLIRPGVPPVAVPDYVTYFSYVLAGLKSVRPDAQVDSYLTPLGRKVIADAKTLCYPNQGRATKGMTVGQLVSRPFDQGPLIPALRAVTRVPVAGYRAPILIQQGNLDPVAFAPLTKNFVDAARKDGATIDFRQSNAGHGLGPWSETAALKWSNQQRWPR